MNLQRAFLLLLVFVWAAEPLAGLGLLPKAAQVKAQCATCHGPCCCRHSLEKSCPSTPGYYPGGCDSGSHGSVLSQSPAKWFAPHAPFLVRGFSGHKPENSQASLPIPPALVQTPPPR
ncbi:MAG TPA: hypothetical protein VJ873_01975, partial [bacterium]|nr:hypothetical protein [bacterium]